ncbi:VWA domain-containing protein [Fictibacillus phosphorivorans]|uniref:VWA domain-containing protein n=1 Tax=Fictibacillus phosphorivorans TaxID=1221500 RepID=UPI00203CEDAF|nr:VWA domain-containing protein [Fictibacillus phosphorivorans]MCM3719806.1 VWA domain-containing protein [Fictibacillus phosphorivorans]MCM3777523.1 VWA domain-containing protein [Fictibacillus phosphorivorans]
MKRNKIFIVLILLFIFTILLVACTNDENKDQPKKSSRTQEETNKEDNLGEKELAIINEAPKPSENLEEILEYPKGQFAGLDFRGNDEDKERILETFEDFPKLNSNTSDEVLDKYWATMVSYYHEDYPSPDEVLEGIKLQSFGNPELEDKRYHFKENLNVEIILDASGSMGAKIGNKTKMELAKDSIKGFASKLPSNANVALRVYGHKGSGSNADKALSCGSSELVYSLQKYNEKVFDDSLNKFDPAGWTPIALALNEAQKDLKSFDSERNTNIIYLVSDGIATCDEDPIKAAKTIADSNIEPIVNILGFDIDNKGQKQLMEIAKASKGTYASVNNADQLNQELDKAKQIAELWEDWKDNAKRDAKSQFIDQKFDILFFSNDFAEAYIRENNNYRYTIRHLRDEGKISKESWRYLDDKRKERFDRMKDYRQEIEKQLDSINEGNLEDAQKELKKMAEENKPN